MKYESYWASWSSQYRRFACKADAQAALRRELKGEPTWLEIQSELVAHLRRAGKGHPRKDASPVIHHEYMAGGKCLQRFLV